MEALLIIPVILAVAYLFATKGHAPTCDCSQCASKHLCHGRAYK